MDIFLRWVTPAKPSVRKMLPPHEEGDGAHIWKEERETNGVSSSLKVSDKSADSLVTLELPNGDKEKHDSTSEELLKPPTQQVAKKDSDSERLSETENSSESCSSHPGSPVDNEHSEDGLLVLEKDDEGQAITEDAKDESKAPPPEVKVDGNTDPDPDPESDESLRLFEKNELAAVAAEMEIVKSTTKTDVIKKEGSCDFGTIEEETESVVHSESGQPLEEESGEDEEAKELLSLINPDLPKIRAQQIQNWLDFENKNDSKRSQLLVDFIKEGGGSGDGINGPELTLESLSTDHAVVTDAAGCQRRVRFLTDPQGNILISVLLTKLVQLIFTILKLASVGYVDFTASSSQQPHPCRKSIASSPTSSSVSNSAFEDLTAIPNPYISSNLSTSSTTCSSRSENLSVSSCMSNFSKANESSSYNPCDSGEGEDEEQQIIQVANLSENGSQAGLTIPQIIENHLAEAAFKTALQEDVADEQLVKTMEMHSETLDNVQEKEECSTGNIIDTMIQDQTVAKKKIDVNPGLNPFDDPGEDSGSESDSNSVSSCSSMIEVVPKDKTENEEKEKLLQFITDDEIDENNNELKTDVIQLETEKEPSVAIFDESLNSTVKSSEEIPLGYSFLNPTTTQTMLDEKQAINLRTTEDIKPKEQAEESTLPKHPDVGVEGNNFQAEPKGAKPSKMSGSRKSVSPLPTAATSPKFKPTLVEIEMKTADPVTKPTATESPAHQTQPAFHADLMSMKMSASDQHNQQENQQAATIVKVNGSSDEKVTAALSGRSFPRGLPNDHDGEQLLSLCIEEEPISAVALTIAKWESFSKQHAADSSTVASSVKGLGKLILPTFINNTGKQCGNAGTPVAAPTPPAKPTSVVVTNNGTGGSGGSSPAERSPSQATMKPSDYAKLINKGNNNHVNETAMKVQGKTPGFRNNGTTVSCNGKVSVSWNNWANNMNGNGRNNDKSLGEDEAIYAQPNSQGGSLATNVANPSSILKLYPKPNSKGEIINWFKEGEIHRSGILLSVGQTSHTAPVMTQQGVTSPVLVSWFFGLITRQQAEELLHGQPAGTFLVRISTRIWGYTLSYQSNNKTKHFLISAINPAVPATLTAGADANGQLPPAPVPTGKQQMLFPFSPGGRYAFIGTNMTPYTTLTSLIRHHSHAPITKAGGEKLFAPCPGGPKITGIEYVFK